MTAKEKLRERIERLSEDEADVALVLVEQRLDEPILRALAKAPEDDEPWTAEDEAAISEGRADVAAGRTLSHEEMLRRYG